MWAESHFEKCTDVINTKFNSLFKRNADAREIAAEAILLQEDKDAVTQQKMAYFLAENVFGRVSRVVSPPKEWRLYESFI